MTNTGDVLPPLPYEELPAGAAPQTDNPPERALDSDDATVELAPDIPPERDIESEPTLMGSPLLRARYPSPVGERGLEADSSRPVSFPDDEGGTKDIPDVLVPVTTPHTEPVVTPVDERTARAISEAVTKEDLTALKESVTALYERVSTELAPNASKAALALGWLSEARTIGLGRPEQFPVAELRVSQTRTLLEQYAQGRAAASRNARGLVTANLLWLLLFAGLFFMDLWVQGGGTGVGTRAVSSLFPPWLCVLAGGLGGALAALVSLGRVLGQREYNPDNDLDYHLNALKGAVLGGVAFYLILGGFVTAAATSGVELGDAVSNGSLMDQIQEGASVSPLYIVIAFIAGLAQQRLLGLLGRVWSQRTGESEPVVTNPDADLAAVTVPVADVPVAVQDEGAVFEQELSSLEGSKASPSVGLG